MQEHLQQFGLSEREAAVYFAALQLGKTTVDAIAKEADIIRTTTYTQIDSLLHKGLMSSVTEGKKTYYSAEDPSNLSRLIEQQKKAAQANESLFASLLPDLTALYSKSGSKPVIRFFPGKEGVITLRAEILKTIESKELCVMTAYDKFLEIFPDVAERNAFTKKRRNKGVSVRMLFTRAGKDASDEFAPEDAKRIDEAAFPFEFDAYIFDNKVALTSLEKDDTWGLLIESKAIERSMRALFNIVWSTH